MVRLGMFNPKNNKRYYLGRPNDAFAVMRELGQYFENRFSKNSLS
jgi:hypothetical protein